MTKEVARNAARRIGQLAWQRFLGHRHPALCSVPRSRSEGEAERLLERSERIAAPKVLVMCLGGIGDTILSFAMLRRLRQRFPKAHLTALTMWPQAADLVRDLGVFDDVLQHNFQEDRGWGASALLARLHLRRFDTSILTFPTNRWEFNMAAWLIHAKQRIGHAYVNSGNLTSLRWLLTNRIEQAMETHTIDENLRLLAETAGQTSLSSGPPVIQLGPLAPAYGEYAEEILADTPGPYLGIHAGTQTFKNMAARRWPAEQFAELCRLAHEHFGLTPLLFGVGSEIDLNKRIVELAGVGHVIETPSIKHTAAIVRYCSAFVSNDSGLAHLAVALDVPTVMVVGPTDPDLIRPYSNGVAVKVDVGCAPCYRPRRAPLACHCSKPFKCLLDITVQQVCEALATVLGSSEMKSATLQPEPQRSSPRTAITKPVVNRLVRDAIGLCGKSSSDLPLSSRTDFGNAKRKLQ